MGHPGISVVLPFFNAESTLAKAVESVLRQTLEDLELILVDDGSSDGSLAVARSFESDRRVRVFSQSHAGVVKASLYGLSKISAPLIARMDADDVALPKKLEKQYAVFAANPDIGVVATQVAYVGNSDKEGFETFVDWSNSIIDTVAIKNNRFVELPVVNPTLVFRKSVIEGLGWYRDGDFPEDYDLVLRYLEADVNFHKIAEPLLEWHDSPDRLTRTDLRYSTEAFYQVKSGYLARWLQANNPYHPKVWIWGGGKLSRQRSALLLEYGIEIAGYIDVRERHLDAPCILYEDLPPTPDRFILSYVGNRGKRAEITDFLTNRQYREGADFLCIA